MEELIAATRKVKVGGPFDPETIMGPVINKRQFDKINDYIKHGRDAEHLEVAHIGEARHNKGYFIEPTIFANVPEDSRLAKEEIFGPVICIMKPFKIFDEAIERANSTKYGLASAVFTTSMDRAERFVREIKSGYVWVNCYNYNPFWCPFGGMKESGFGRDNGEEALHEHTTIKTVVYKYDFQNV